MPLSSSAVSVNTSATLLADDNSGVVHIRPTSGDIYIGGPDVTAAAGMLLKQDEVYDDSLFRQEGDAIYGVASSGTVSVRVLRNTR